MATFILFLLLHTHFSMTDSIRELNPSDLMQCLGQSAHSIKLFATDKMGPAANDDIERYFPRKITLSVKNPGRFVIFGITVEEVHLKVSESDIMEAVFVQLDNQELVKKLTKLAGEDYIASGGSPGEDTSFSYYSWD